ncbi:MAG: DUF1272 domain-containing protein [Gammaproteobacteria bacterium]|nr:DUF1272 domain-containing protein [Gammaproteobacteria bacterium]
MLELRPNCECCDKDLPPNSTDARICSFECTFCSDCVEKILLNVCPNCGGGFTLRPIRPSLNHRGDNYIGTYPASTKRVIRSIEPASQLEFASRLKDIPPHRR